MADDRPVLAVTMGDPAGIGPEITIKALLTPEVQQFSRPFVVGDLAVLRQALGFCQLAAKFNYVSGPAEAHARTGEIDVLDLGIADPTRLKIGAVQPLGGEAASAYIRRAIELAMQGEVGAVVTAPINKTSFERAHVPYIGHTEMFADLTGVTGEMTMFSVGELKIFFLTRHMPLIEACRSITQESVLTGIGNAMRALDQIGYPNPHLAVAALNPHAGENGLLGREEIDQIAPAVAEASRRSWRVSGPLPADSVFHFARLGRFDAVLSLYHDQGHVAAKMLDFERTVSVTLGLPIMRTSVDHGTGFDIAGTGKASAVSMIEALRVGARYAGRGLAGTRATEKLATATAG